ncbi:adenine phosphoribosyltransferase [bacterium CG_4_9_14_3_um_filter_65_15]|nr:MAG: adenine phosphoribosyltransferase [bacterium CG_4_9_14_3_um_filter_65_15]
MTHRERVVEAIRAIPDFPQPGILFRDITPVMEDPAVFTAAIDGLQEMLRDVKWDKVAAIESRGFLFGAPLALRAGKPLVLLRKAGKLPGETRAVTYDLEYGQATLEVHTGSLQAGDRVLILDDLLATGGTAAAGAQLVQEEGAQVAGFGFLVALDELGGGARLAASGPVFSLVNY